VAPVDRRTERLKIGQHCAHFQKSACVAGWEKKYMRDGTLPPEGTVCEVDYPDLFLAAAELAGDAAEGLSGAL
jgi:hypothetical protein